MAECLCWAYSYPSCCLAEASGIDWAIGSAAECIAPDVDGWVLGMGEIEITNADAATCSAGHCGIVPLGALPDDVCLATFNDEGCAMDVGALALGSHAVGRTKCGFIGTTGINKKDVA